MTNQPALRGRPGTSTMPSYRDHILTLASPMLKRIEVQSVLDFGCGDGFFATRMPAVLGQAVITPIDVYRRPNCLVEPIIYDGGVLPFADRQFDLAYAIDVLHHCKDPLANLRDLMRCTGRYLFLKDHTYTNAAGYAALCILDELGNRRFHIPSLYHYQKRMAWVQLIESSGFRRVELIHPAPVHTGLLGAATNGLQFIGLWERA
jgi:SAM-dependent methyltransferase